MRLAADASSDLRFEKPLCIPVSLHWSYRQVHFPPIGSDARQGIAALVPSRSLTLTMIIGSPEGALGAGTFFAFSDFSRSSGAFARTGDRDRSRCR